MNPMKIIIKHKSITLILIPIVFNVILMLFSLHNSLLSFAPLTLPTLITFVHVLDSQLAFETVYLNRFAHDFFHLFFC